MWVLITATSQVHTVMFGCRLVSSETASGMSTMAGGRWKEAGHFGLCLGCRVGTYSPVPSYIAIRRIRVQHPAAGVNQEQMESIHGKGLTFQKYTRHFIKNNCLETAILTPGRDNPRGHVVKLKCSLEKWTGETMLLVKPLSAKSHQFQRG